MADIRVRTRDGCRGGREQFTWNSIKDQEFKDREQYLGQSTKVGMMGKFGKYHLHDWYARTRETAASIDSEKAQVKAFEEELMQEALGLKPKKLMLAKKQLSEDEVKEYLKRDDQKNADKKGREVMGPQKKIVTNEYGEQVAASNEDYIGEAAREAPVKGLGFASHRTTKLEEIKAATLGTESQLQGTKSCSSKADPDLKAEVKQEVKAEPQEDEDRGAAGSGSAHGIAEVKLKEEVKIKEELDAEGRRLDKKRRREEETPEQRRARKAAKGEKKTKKAEKKLKKAEKKAKKAAKKEKKAAKAARKMSTSSSSSSS
mmetsp:Transcript_92748/g.239536  ORF Transcript_92748/g.239536 Transcript_92748/m.239536 type:complete len:316 (-) Transcript_92748:245-1192(-)